MTKIFLNHKKYKLYLKYWKAKNILNFLSFKNVFKVNIITNFKNNPNTKTWKMLSNCVVKLKFINDAFHNWVSYFDEYLSISQIKILSKLHSINIILYAKQIYFNQVKKIQTKTIFKMLLKVKNLKLKKNLNKKVLLMHWIWDLYDWYVRFEIRIKLLLLNIKQNEKQNLLFR